MGLNVLMLEAEPGAGEVAEAKLVSEGHRVVRCHDVGAPAFPCNALRESGCPLRTQNIDVALAVRWHPQAHPATTEDGATCALVQHVPLVIAGPSVMNPYADYATETVETTLGVVDACVRAATAPLPEHTARAQDALRETLWEHDPDGTATASVTRVNGALRVVISDADHIDAGARSTAAVRVMAALRAFDTDANGVDVVFTGSDRT